MKGLSVSEVIDTFCIYKSKDLQIQNTRSDEKKNTIKNNIMQELHKLLDQLQSNISSFDKVNLSVSSGSVGWHIAHSLKTIDQIVTACKHSNPNEYQWHFNFNRFLIMSVAKKIPRGKAKAPKIVRPEGEISLESLILSLEKVKANLKNWENLDKNAHFPHPYFGVLNKKETENFLVLHTKHHGMIVKDILKS